MVQAPIQPESPTASARTILPAITSFVTQTIRHALLAILAVVFALLIFALVAWLYVAPGRGWIWATTNFVAAATLLVSGSMILGVPIALNLAAARTVERHRIATQLLAAATGRHAAALTTTGGDARSVPSASSLQRSLADEMSDIASAMTSASRRPRHRLRSWLIRRALRWLLADLMPMLERMPIAPNASTADWLHVTGPIIDHTLASTSRKTALRLAMLWGCVAIAILAGTIVGTQWP